MTEVPGPLHKEPLKEQKPVASGFLGEPMDQAEIFLGEAVRNRILEAGPNNYIRRSIIDRLTYPEWMAYVKHLTVHPNSKSPGH